MNRNDFLHALAEAWKKTGRDAGVVYTTAGDVNYVRLFSARNDSASFDVCGNMDMLERMTSGL